MSADGGTRRTPRYVPGLSAKLLLLTILFVMLAEVFVFVPSVSNFRRQWLMERLAAAQIASLAAEAAPGGQLPTMLRDELLKQAKVKAIAVKRAESRVLIIEMDMPADIDASYDLRHASWLALIADALMVYVAPDDRVIRVIGEPGFHDGEFIEVVMGEGPLKTAMIRYGLDILGLSILISIITAAFVYLSLDALLVKPMTKLTWNIVRFSERPEDPTRTAAVTYGSIPGGSGSNNSRETHPARLSRRPPTERVFSEAQADLGVNFRHGRPAGRSPLRDAHRHDRVMARRSAAQPRLRPPPASSLSVAESGSARAVPRVARLTRRWAGRT